MSAYAVGVGVFFADPHLTLKALYREGGAGAGRTVIVIASRADTEATYGQARVVAETGAFDVRAAEVAAPAEGDTLTVAGRTYVVAGAPVMDDDRLVWTLATRVQP